ncbi:MAG: serine protease, partial [Planctomycetota bacterium]
MTKPSHEHLRRLADMLRQVSPDGDFVAMDCSPTRDVEESFARSTRSLSKEVDGAKAGLRALIGGRPDKLSPDQALGLEAIVLPRYRPVVDVIENDFHPPPKPWTHLGTRVVRDNLRRAIPSIGRVEVPAHPTVPYAGTGFVVGDGILMTNRHVAELFAVGLGRKRLDFQSGQSASLDFRREILPSEPVLLDVEEILMIHPHFDMALLKVAGLGSQHAPLILDVSAPSDLIENDVVVIGYPAQDLRNNPELQNQVFRGVFNVKRVQPGKLKSVESLQDFYGNRVDTVTHDCSTLGGNSGSAVIDVATGNVVALHFAGEYLRANYALPIRELARDPRVAETGLRFNDKVTPSEAWDKKWKIADEEMIQDSSSAHMVNDVAMVGR